MRKRTIEKKKTEGEGRNAKTGKRTKKRFAEIDWTCEDGLK